MNETALFENGVISDEINLKRLIIIVTIKWSKQKLCNGITDPQDEWVIDDNDLLFWWKLCLGN